MGDKNYILDKLVSAKKLERIAYEIAERNADAKEIILAGIQENGYVIAENIIKILKTFYPAKVSLISIEIDKKDPRNLKISPETDITDKILIIVDDVANTGKTLTYALKPFLEMYPAAIQTMIFVERTHKLFPIRADYVGFSLATTLQEQIIVEVSNKEITGAYLI